MNLAIIGSRALWGNREACDLICSEIERLKPTLIISGGAIGVDKMAEWIGKYVYGIQTKIFHPLTSGTFYYMQRDRQIAEAADEVLAVMVVGGSGGTKATLGFAQQLGKSCYIYEVREGGRGIWESH